MNDNSSDRDPVEALAEEFMERKRRGERPTLEEYASKYPHLATEIRDLFPALVVMEDFKPETDSIVESAERLASITDPAFKEIGDYRILREVGRGGMGIVYEAEQVSLGRRVALKVLPKNLLGDARQKHRFEREARAAARLHHTNIVPVFGVGEQNGMHYYVMQFIQGLGLDEVLNELKRLQSGSGAMASPTGELRVTRRESAAHSQEAGAVRAGQTRLVSATAIAQSLVTGQFAASHDTDDAPTHRQLDETLDHQGLQPAVGKPDPAKSSTMHGRLSDTFSLSDSANKLGRSGRVATGDTHRSYWQSVADIGVQVASALQYAHDQGLVHRDIKPSNLLLDIRGTVWVTDFGLAKAEDQQNLTQAGDILGTLRYMPPEAFEGQSDTRGDIYSLGLTLYELLALEPAFAERDRHRLIKQATQGAVTRLEKVNASIPRDLITIVHKAIEREPAHRYTTAAELAMDLQRYLEDKPILARRVSLAERFHRWSRHNRSLAAALVTIAMLLTATAIGSAFAAARFRQVAQDNSRLATQKEQQRAAAVEAKNEADAARQREAELRKRAELAEQTARSQQQRAEDNAAKARAAVDAYLSRITESPRLKAPGMQRLRRELLQLAIPFYQEFLRQNADDPNLRIEIADTYLRLGRMNTELGIEEEARKALQSAIDAYEKAVRSDPQNADWRDTLADVWEAMGDLDYQLANAGRDERMFKAYQRMTNERETLVKAHPKNFEFKKKLAVAYNRYGIAQSALGQTGEAFDSHRKSAEIRHELIRAFPDDPTLSYGLGESFLNLGSYLTSNQHHEQALEMYLRSQELYEFAYGKMPHMVEYGVDLGSAYEQAGMALRNLGREEEARSQDAKSLEHFRAMVRAHPDVPTLALRLIRALRVHARNEQAADPLFNRTSPEPPSAWLLAVSAQQRANSGKLLREIGELIEGLPHETADDFIQVARHWTFGLALLHGITTPLSPEEQQAEELHITKAIEAIRQAVDRGFSDVTQLTDSNFEPLRERAEFKKVFADLEAKLDANRVADNSHVPRPTHGEIPTEAKTTTDQQATPIPEPALDEAMSLQTIAMIQFDLGRTDDAIQSLKSALEIADKLVSSDKEADHSLQARAARIHLALGTGQWKVGRLTDARQSWKKAIAILGGLARPQDRGIHDQLAEAYWTIASGYAEAGLWTEATEYATQAFETGSPGSPLNWLHGTYLFARQAGIERSKSHLDQMITKFSNRPDPESRFMVSRARNTLPIPETVLQLLGPPSRPIQATSDALSPEERFYAFELALEDYRRGKYQSAIDRLQHCDEMNVPISRPLLAMAHHQLGQESQARDALQQADRAHHRLIQALLASERPLFPETANSTWMNYCRLDVLRREAKNLIEGNEPPENPLESVHRSRVYLALGDTAKADAEFRAAVAAMPDQPQPWLIRSREFTRMGQHERADADWKNAISMKGQDPQLLIEIGRWFLKHGDAAKGDAILEQAATLIPGELNQFLAAGWWIVGPFPENLQLECAPEKNPDPSKPIRIQFERVEVPFAAAPKFSPPPAPASNPANPKPTGAKPPEPANRASQALSPKAVQMQVQLQMREPAAGVMRTLPATPKMIADSGLDWQLQIPHRDGFVNLRDVFREGHLSCYGVTWIGSPESRPATLLIGGADALRVWLNGKMVHEDTGGKNPNALRLDRVPVVLQKGKNTLVVKVSNSEGAFHMWARLSDSPVDRALEFAQVGRYDEALVQVRKHFDEGFDDEWGLWRLYAMLLMESGDRGGYQKLVNGIMERHRNATAGTRSWHVAQVLCLSATPPVDAKQMVQFAKTALDEAPRDPSRMYQLGLAEFRAGQTEAAIQRLTKLDETTNSPNVWLVLAMAQEQLKKSEEAKQYLAQADKAFEEMTRAAAAAPEKALPRSGEFWAEFVVLRREAGQLIAGAPAFREDLWTALKAKSLESAKSPP